MDAVPTTRHYPRAIAMLIGTIIGVGIFGVPYVVARSGALFGLAHFVVITAVLLFVHLSFGELTLRTKAHHRLVGYAERYFGPWGKGIAAVAGIAGIYGALLAYIIIGGSFLHQLLGPTLGGTPWLYSVAFSAVGVIVIAFGLRMVEELEFILTAFLFIAMALIFIVGAQRVNTEHWNTVYLSNAFLPYGAILFSLGGASAIAEIRDILRGRERLLARAITWGTLIAAALTAIFVFIVVGVSGTATTPEAIAGLAPTLGRSIVLLGAILGILAIATSFLSLGIYVDEVFQLDFHLSKPTALFLGIMVPIGIFLIGQPEFTKVILVTGGIFGGLDGIIILLTTLRARRMGDRQPEFALRVPAVVHWIVVLMFVAGIGVTIWETFR
ncbi:MAG: aromatic amino acid transport family protein [bacterium]|nr:aromatic amino acid transport family protein [bacterium]